MSALAEALAAAQRRAIATLIVRSRDMSAPELLVLPVEVKG